MLKPYKGPKITNDEVRLELEKLQKTGWEVYALEAPNQYLIDISDDKQITISFSGMEWSVIAKLDGRGRFVKRATSIESFVRLLDEAANTLSVDLGVEPPKNTQRLKKNEPATNTIKLSQLIEPRSIKYIYDPYFDTQALKTLLSLNKLGLKFSNPLSCLTGSGMKTRIDSNFANDFAKETNTVIEIKAMFSKEHRRFIVLDDNKVIIIGCSLNDLDKNETLREEDSKEDIQFFENEWDVAEKIV